MQTKLGGNGMQEIEVLTLGELLTILFQTLQLVGVGIAELQWNQLVCDGLHFGNDEHELLELQERFLDSLMQ